MLVTHGRVAGVSGFSSAACSAPDPRLSLRIAFVLGLVLAGVGALLIAPQLVPTGVRPSSLIAAIAGLVVGFGTRLGNGCTSGHGICGISRWSVRSITLATGTFMATGAITVFCRGATSSEVAREPRPVLVHRARRHDRPALRRRPWSSRA